jgi:hypothetical protein
MSHDIHCPQCGQAARTASEQRLSESGTAYQFECTNQGCKLKFAGVMELTKRLPLGVQAFTPRDTDALTDC